MTEPKTCPRCGTAVRAEESPAGLCAACLMKMGFDSRSGAAGVVYTEGEKTERPPAPTIAELAPHFPELEIRELVGHGGMGAVYRARQRSLERDVALKILTVGTGDPTFADRFQREARTLASLSHPGIVAVYDFGLRGPWSFLAMEFVEGASLRQMLRAREVGSRESLAIVSQMCDALQYAHDQGVVHRDIKPENVLVARDGRIKVLDFGLAKLVGAASRAENLTQPRQVMGTPHYMAPEQWEKPLTVDHRADIYALGVVFYELLTGELPLGRFEPPSHKVTLDVRLDDVVLRSLEKEPGRRYQHASQVKDDVAGITSTPGGVPPPMPVPAARTRSSRHKWLIVGAGLGCLVLLLVPLAFTFLVFTGKSRAELAADAAQERARQEISRALDQSIAKETTLAKFGLSRASASLFINTAAGQRLGLDAVRLGPLNAAFESIWERYLEFEKARVAADWLVHDRLDVRAPAAPGVRDQFIVEARAAIALACEASTVPGAKDALELFVAQLVRFGAAEEHLEISMFADAAQVTTFRAEGSTTILESPASSAARRLWDRMLPTGPPPPK